MTKRKILVLGDGAWGTALALNLYHNGHQVRVWGAFPDYITHLKKQRENTTFLPGVKIPAGIEFYHNIETALEAMDLMVLAVPTQHARSVLLKVKPFYSPVVPIVSVAKGIEHKTLARPSEIIKEILKAKKIAVLSGPSHAEEVARRLPASVVLASRDKKFARDVQRIFMNERFRIYTHSDMIGVELCGALKNIIAIAAGICDGLKLGDNAKSALLTRGLVEITRLGVKMGARSGTFFGLAGLGDLITTCISPHGRNREVGIRIGQGETLARIMKTMKKVAEGVSTTQAVYPLIRKYKIAMPITNEIYQVLFKNKNPRQAVSDLMTRQPKAEEIRI